MPNLNPLTLIQVTGEDAQSFLQGQFTNDVTAITEQWQLSGICNPKGRLIVSFLIFQHQDAYNLIVQSDIAETLVKRLSMYVLRSKVVIKTTDTAISFEAKQANASFVEVDKSIKQVDHKLELDLGFGNLIIDSESDNLKQTFDNDWLYHFTENGIVLINSLNSENFTPQTINFDLLNGVNFKKGCYTGQEVVARMHYLGKAKKRLFLCLAEQALDPTTIQPTAKVFTNSELEKSAGEIVNFASKQQQTYLLIILNTEDHPNILYASDKTPITVLENQPFNFA